MGNHTGLSPNNVLKYLGPNVYLSVVVTRNREPTGADYRQPETGNLYPFATFWLVGKDPTTGVQGDLWYLSKIVANVAYWIKMNSGGGGGSIVGFTVDANTPPGTNPVLPDFSGYIDITGGQVASGVVGANVIRSDSLAANQYTIEIQQAGTAAAQDTTLNGVCHFNSADFTVVNGFVSSTGGGGGGITTIAGNTGSSNGPTVTFNGDTPGNPNAGASVAFTFTGDLCQLNLSDASSNTFLGLVSGFLKGGGAANNTFVGGQSGVRVDSANNTGMGYQNLNSLVGGDGFNAVFGQNGFYNLVDGAYNIGLGQNCGDDVGTSARSNIMIGNRGIAGDNNTMRLGTQGSSDGQIDSTFIAGIASVTVSNAEMVVVDTTTGEMGSQAIPSGSLGVDSFTPNSGTSPVVPDVTGNVVMQGVGSITTVGGTNSLTHYLTGVTNNIGIAYSAGTFTVQSADGSAFSSTNLGYVLIPSKANPGRLAKIAVSANQTFTDGSAGSIDNARFGVTTGVNWAQDMPYFLYAVMNDAENLINFMISRNPCATTSPASTSISKTGAIINVNQADFFSLDNITVTDYDSNPCICLGSFRMQFAGATDSWTVQTLSNNDGIGNFNDNQVFTFPSGQNGAAAGTYILSNAGTEPVWTTNGMVYTIQKNGQVRYNFNGQAPSTTGVGAQTLQPVFPYALSSSNQEDSINGRYTSAITQAAILVSIASSASFASSIYITGGTVAITNADMTIAAANSLQFQAVYRAFTKTGL